MDVRDSVWLILLLYIICQLHDLHQIFLRIESQLASVEATCTLI